MRKEDGFTLIEVIVSICVFSVLCFSFLTALQFAYKSYNTSKEQFEVLTKAENSLEKIKSTIKECSREDLNPEMIFSIIEKAEDPDKNYIIQLGQTNRQGLYNVEITFKESRYERLWTQIYLP